MSTELHPKAAESFNSTADTLFAQLKLVLTTQPSPPFRPDIHISANLSLQDIKGPIRTTRSIVNFGGDEVGRIIGSSDNQLALDGESYNQLLLLLSRMQRSSNSLSAISTKSLLNMAFAWMEKRLTGNVGQSFTDYILGEAQGQIQQFELWVPIHCTYSEQPITIGEVTFETITRQMLDEYEQRMTEKFPQNAAVIKERVAKERKLMQGTIAAKLSLRAERVRASELAREKAEDAAAFLRFLSPANWTPRLRSYCTLLGAENRVLNHELHISNYRIIGRSEGIFDRGEPAWVLSANDLANSKDILNSLHELAKAPRTAFQQSLHEALLVYARNSLVLDPSDKLIYILVALESLLLRNENEPIQKNIAERMAFLIGEDLSSRKEVVANVLAAYGMRSSFVHHGNRVEDLKTLENFMLKAWTCFCNLLLAQQQFKSKDDLITMLENRKLS